MSATPSRAEQVLPAALRVGRSLLRLLDEPGFARLATGEPESNLVLHPESGGKRGDAGSHLSRVLEAL